MKYTTYQKQIIKQALLGLKDYDKIKLSVPTTEDPERHANRIKEIDFMVDNLSVEIERETYAKYAPVYGEGDK